MRHATSSQTLFLPVTLDSQRYGAKSSIIRKQHISFHDFRMQQLLTHLREKGCYYSQAPMGRVFKSGEGKLVQRFKTLLGKWDGSAFVFPLLVLKIFFLFYRNLQKCQFYPDLNYQKASILQRQVLNSVLWKITNQSYLYASLPPGSSDFISAFGLGWNKRLHFSVVVGLCDIRSYCSKRWCTGSDCGIEVGPGVDKTDFPCTPQGTLSKACGTQMPKGAQCCQACPFSVYGTVPIQDSTPEKTSQST